MCAPKKSVKCRILVEKWCKIVFFKEIATWVLGLWFGYFSGICHVATSSNMKLTAQRGVVQHSRASNLTFRQWYKAHACMPI
jgi:hypothetical protein